MRLKLAAALMALPLLAACAPEIESTIYTRDIDDALESGKPLAIPATLKVPQTGSDTCAESLPKLVENLGKLTPIKGAGKCIEDSVALARELKPRGVDVIDCSSGGFDGYALKAGPLYQLPLSVAVRETGIATMAVGLINDPQASEAIVENGEADLVALARGALEDPNWAIHAHHVLDGGEYSLWPKQARDRIRAKDRVLGIRQ
jgi:hypothetical protein